jgi:hypothetical protein
VCIETVSGPGRVAVDACRIVSLTKQLAEKSSSASGRSGIEVGANKDNLYIVTPDEQVWRRPVKGDKKTKVTRVNPGELVSCTVGAKTMWGCDKSGAVKFSADVNAAPDKMDWKTVQLVGPTGGDVNASAVSMSPEFVYVTSGTSEIYRLAVDGDGKVKGGKIEGGKVRVSDSSKPACSLPACANWAYWLPCLAPCR